FESLSERRDGAEVRLLQWQRVRGPTVQEHRGQPPGTLRDLLQRQAPGADDQRLPGLLAAIKKGAVSALERGDLEARDQGCDDVEILGEVASASELEPGLLGFPLQELQPRRREGQGGVGLDVLPGLAALRQARWAAEPLELNAG